MLTLHPYHLLKQFQSSLTRPRRITVLGSSPSCCQRVSDISAHLVYRINILGCLIDTRLNLSDSYMCPNLNYSSDYLVVSTISCLLI